MIQREKEKDRDLLNDEDRERDRIESVHFRPSLRREAVPFHVSLPPSTTKTLKHENPGPSGCFVEERHENKFIGIMERGR